MTIRIELANDNSRATRFATSPAVEAVLALNALLFPSDRPLQHPWIRSTRALPVSLRREFRAFGFVFDHALPDVLLPKPTRATEVPWQTTMDELRQLDAGHAGYELLRPAFHYVLPGAPTGPDALDDDAVRAIVLQRAGARGRDAVALARQAFARPGEFRDRFAALLEGFWEACFRSVWDSIGPQLVRIARRDARTAATCGVYKVLDARFAATRVNPAEGWFERASPHRHTVRPSRARPLVFIPSVFTWPHVRVNCDAPWPLAAIYPPSDVRAEADLHQPHADLVEPLGLLGDPVRLAILRAVAERPRPTQELAPLVRRSAGVTSRHLALLEARGLVAAQRDGHYVLYSAVPERLDNVLEALRAYLRAPGRRR